MTIPRSVLPALAASFLLSASAWAQTPLHQRGTIDSLQGQTLLVTIQSGTKVTVALRPDTPITAIVPAAITDVKPGSYIGTAAMPQPDGSLRAFEIQLFPESMRGVGEGHRPWDLQPQSTMTNGTVGTVVGASGRSLTLDYQGGEKTVTVPVDAPVITYQPGDISMLVPGAHVIVTGKRLPDGVISADRIGVGKNGLVPPM